MKTIELDGLVYYCPLSGRFRRHDAEERERMDECKAFRAPVLTYHDTTLKLDPCLVDGEGRVESSVRSGAGLRFEHLGDMTTDQAYELAKELNDARRHEDPESIRQRRQETVASKRSEGKSIRTIAGEMGVPKSTVADDLSGVRRRTPEPETVTGEDGKTYPATRPEPAPVEPEPEPESDDESAADTLPPDEPERPAYPFTPPPAPPPHVFADLMNAVVSLNRLLTTAIGRDTPQAGRLKTYLTHARLIEYTPEKFAQGKRTEARAVFLPLKGVRRVIDLAGADEPERSEKDIRTLYDIASGGFVPPVHTRRRTAKKGKGKK